MVNEPRENALTDEQQKLAAELRAHRQQVLSIARTPGLSGISRSAGVTTLEAILDDVARNVALALTNPGDVDAYRAFIEAAKGA